nr:hypothetical protein L204_05744 [Cryptococcus depauperatus CBS 7855]
MCSDLFRASTPLPPEDRKEPHRPSLQALVGQPLKITLIDSRIIMGYFTCVDKQCNIVLSDAEEFRPPPASLVAKEEALARGGKLVGELAEETQEERVWKNREKYWPKSEPFSGPGSGWGGRGLSMVCMKKSDIVKIEVEKEIWHWMGGR